MKLIIACTISPQFVNFIRNIEIKEWLHFIQIRLNYLCARELIWTNHWNLLKSFYSSLGYISHKYTQGNKYILHHLHWKCRRKVLIRDFMRKKILCRNRDLNPRPSKSFLGSAFYAGIWIFLMQQCITLPLLEWVLCWALEQSLNQLKWSLATSPIASTFNEVGVLVLHLRPCTTRTTYHCNMFALVADISHQ